MAKNYNGYHFTDLWNNQETKEKIIATLTKQRNTKEYKEQQSNLMKQCWQQEEYRKKQEIAWTEERKQQLSQRSKRNWQKDEYRAKITKAISERQKKKWEDAFGIPYPEGDNAYFIYHGQVMDAATLGNVTYSYIGAKYYSDFALYSGGAAVQTKRRDPSDIPYMYTLPDYGDMPEDHESIGLGIKWRKEGFPDDN